MIHRIFDTDPVKIINLATGKDSRKNLMLLRRSQNKDSVTGRFLQCFQECVESGSREHMHLIDNIYLIFTDLWRDAHLFHQLTDIIHRIVGSGIKFMDIIRPLFVESHTRFAFVAGFTIGSRRHTVDGFGEDSRTSSLSHPARSAKQISMSQFLGSDCIL